jgi:hypothetical protein
LGRAGAIIKPTRAVNTASAITRGFINVMKADSRDTEICREAKRRRGKAIAVVFIVNSSMEIAFVSSRKLGSVMGLTASR